MANGNMKFYMWIGSFAIIMMIYLFLAPKLVKKPSGTPPRAGSNVEKALVQTMTAGTPATNLAGTPAAVGLGPRLGAGRLGSMNSPAGSSIFVAPEGARGPKTAGLSFGGSDVSVFRPGGAFRARRKRGRAFRGLRSRSPNLNMFPFANVAVA